MPTEHRTIHPIRGLLWGLLLGIGLATALVLATVISFDAPAIAGIVVATAIAGLLWSTIGPARVGTEPETDRLAPYRERPRQHGPRPASGTTALGGTRHRSPAHEVADPSTTTHQRPRAAERVVAT